MFVVPLMRNVQNKPILRDKKYSKGFWDWWKSGER